MNSQFKKQLMSRINPDLFNEIKLLFIFSKDTILITNSDDVYGYGVNIMQKQSEPTLISELSGKNIIKVHRGHTFLAALTEQGEMYAWKCQSRLPDCTELYSKPEQVDMSLVHSYGTQVVDMHCTNNRTFLLTQSGVIFYFCYYFSSEFNDKNLTKMKGMDDKPGVVQLHTGSNQSLALTQNGLLYVLRNNAYNGLDVNEGDSILLNQYLTRTLPTKIASGAYHSLVLSRDGDIYAFGVNNHGQLGLGNTKTLRRPALILVPKIRFVDIFTNRDTSMALSDSGIVYVWGFVAETNVLEPMKTEFTSFQEAINQYFNPIFTPKPITRDEIFEPINPIIKRMENAFNEQKYSDLKFKIDNQFIYVHKWFVAENCKHFDTMFSSEWSESKSNEIEITGHSYEAYYAFLRYLYTDSIDTKDTDVLLDLLDITNEYFEENLKQKCAQKLKAFIDLENVCSLYSVALKYSCADLKNSCFNHMVHRMDEIIETEGFEQMDSNYAKILFIDYIKYSKKRIDF